MNKVISYAKIGCYLNLIIAVLYLICWFAELGNSSGTISLSIYVAHYLFLFVIFLIMCQYSVKGSKIKILSILAMVACALLIIRALSVEFVSSIYTGASTEMLRSLLALYNVVLVIAFSWLATFFEKKSLQRISSILIAVMTLVTMIIFLLMPLLRQNITFSHTQLVIIYSMPTFLKYCSASFFMYSLSKLK